ncbi:MAG: hypothetical protein IPK35_06475 [Saprospiraceae bacterium]|nr:hypothetical protein [Saprospiraceae bacterium]
MTPLGNSLRVGGTMELTGINSDINMKRVKPIVDAANDYYPDLHTPGGTSGKKYGVDFVLVRRMDYRI